MPNDPKQLPSGDELKLPQPSVADDATTVVGLFATGATTLTGFDLAGPLAVPALHAFLNTQVGYRRDRFLEALGSEIEGLKRKFAEFSDLESNESFKTAFVHALPAAIRTHQEEKLRALRNAVINAASVDPDDDRAQLYIRYVDELAPGHIRLLNKILERADELYSISSHHDLMVKLSPGIVPDPAWAHDFRVILQDLETRLLIRVSPAIEELDDVFREQLVTTTGEQKARPMILVTRVGLAFLEFIGDPVEWRFRKGARGEVRE